MLDLRTVVDDRERVREDGASGEATLRALREADPWTLDAERRPRAGFEQIRHRQRLAGEEIARPWGARARTRGDLKAEMRGWREEDRHDESWLSEIEKRLRDVLWCAELVDDTVPVAADAAGHVEGRRSASRRPSPCPAAPLGAGRRSGLLDFERAARVSGARFAVLWGGLARLERARSSSCWT